jgi:hypothetical protein
MRYRYASVASPGLKLIKTLYLLTFIGLVPVVGLDPFSPCLHP